MTSPDDRATNPARRWDELPARLAEVRARIDAAAAPGGRPPGSVRLIAVTKKLPAQAVAAALRAGVGDFGENYVQEGLAKRRELDTMLQPEERAAADRARWHMIGRVQSNKAAQAAAAFAFLHGIDSMSAVRVIAGSGGHAPKASLLLQIRLGGGEGRGGVEPDEAEAFLREAAQWPAARFAGVMAVADPARPARPQFAGLAELASRLRDLRLENASMTEISAGMSEDFEDAVAEGATMVRVGTALFGPR